jgi:hypothetical protein
MSIAGHVSRAMLSRNSHVPMEAKRNVLEEIAAKRTDDEKPRKPSGGSRRRLRTSRL